VAYCVRKIARASSFLQLSLMLATADIKQVLEATISGFHVSTLFVEWQVPVPPLPNTLTQSPRTYSLLQHQPSFMDNLGPKDNLRFDEVGKLLRRAAGRLGANLLQ